MKKLIFLLIAIALLFSSRMFAQDCNCTIAEVENNTVYPCNFIVGTVDTVTTTSELKNAIIQANATGGNRTILIADGTYQIASTSWYPYITASNVVFRSLSGNRDAVILTGNGMADVAPDVEIGIFAVGDNITVADLTLRGFGNHGIAVSGDSLFVYNVKIQNTFEQMIKGVSSGDGSDYSRVQCSLFEYPDGVGPQWYIGGLDIHKADNWIVNDNIFKNIASPSVAVAEHAVHFWNFSSNNTVERNLIINCDRGIGFGLGSSPNDGGMIRNNMIYNDGTGLFDDVGIGLETSPNTNVYNNTIYIEYPNAIEYRFAETTNVAISNNLTNKLIKSRNGGQAILTTNNTNGQADWFVNLSAGDLRLMPNNPSVIDQGTTLFEVMVDIDQTQRPQSANFDIGGHEYLPPVSINNEIIDNTISILPNPTYGVFTIDLSGEVLEHAIIYNGLGQVIKEVRSLEVNISNFDIGIYFVKITSQSGKTATKKVIKY
jgi:Secretion system C-terminal sorting domain